MAFWYRGKWFAAESLATNPFRRGKLAYVVEAPQWAIRYVGQCITADINHRATIGAFTTASAWGLRKKVIHFGSLHTILHHNKPRRLESINRHVLTIFHLIPGKTSNSYLSDLVAKINVFHTASQITKKQLMELGVPEQKIVVIPLGVDLKVFAPIRQPAREALRRQLNISEETFVIGSFQKDGVGWKSGTTPKLEKGPDVLVEVVREVARHHPVHVMLVGPARGYVEQALRRHGISFTNVGPVEHAGDVAPYYASLDCYLISSRIEGGPLTLLESWASSVPVVSTSVGMVRDAATHGVNALIAPVENTSELTRHVESLIKNEQLRRQLTEAARAQVQQSDWPRIAERYLTELYQPLLTKI